MQYWHDLNNSFKFDIQQLSFNSPAFIAASKSRSCFSVRPGLGICLITSSIMVWEWISWYNLLAEIYSGLRNVLKSWLTDFVSWIELCVKQYCRLHKHFSHFLKGIDRKSSDMRFSPSFWPHVDIFFEFYLKHVLSPCNIYDTSWL